MRISDWSSDVCSSDLNRFVTEARNGCAANCTGKPLHLQSMARHIVDAPDHRGIANALAHLRELIANAAAFSDVRVPQSWEFAEAIQLVRFDDPDEGFAAIARRRTHARPKLHPTAISTMERKSTRQTYTPHYHHPRQ